MRKLCSALLFLLAFVKLTNAQTLNVSGTVKDENNKPVSLVSITIEKQANGIATDNSGNFKLTIPKYSRLTFSAVGYKDTVLVIESESPLNIVLHSTAKQLSDVTVTDAQKRAFINEQLKNEITQAEFMHYSAETGFSTDQIVVNSGPGFHTVSFAKNGGTYYGTAVPEFHSKEDTRGSLYLFDNWNRGVVANNNDSNLIADADNRYNINKITGDLVMTRDFQSALTVDKSQVKFFTLYDSLKNIYSFMIVPAINPNLFCEIVALGNNYDIFKLTTTKFVKADFRSDGIASSGNNYDEYVDTKQYYLLKVSDGSVTKFDLKKKAIKQLFANNATAQQFLDAHKADDVNDAYLKSLISSIN